MHKGKLSSDGPRRALDLPPVPEFPVLHSLVKGDDWENDVFQDEESITRYLEAHPDAAIELEAKLRDLDGSVHSRLGSGPWTLKATAHHIWLKALIHNHTARAFGSSAWVSMEDLKHSIDKEHLNWRQQANLERETFQMEMADSDSRMYAMERAAALSPAPSEFAQVARDVPDSELHQLIDSFLAVPGAEQRRLVDLFRSLCDSLGGFSEDLKARAKQYATERMTKRNAHGGRRRSRGRRK